MNAPLEFGLDTFGGVPSDPAGTAVPHAQVIRDVVAEGVLADRLGVDAFNVGEHHRRDFAVSAPSLIQAGLATATSQIRLGTAVTVLSSDDPIRVFEQTSTVHALSGGRAEVTLGRGSFTESFPLFGHDLADYERLFAEKLDLFAAIRDAGPEGRVRWEGSVRPPVDAVLYPPPQSPFTSWVAVGGSPESVVRAADYRFPLMLAIIGGDPLRFAPFVELYHRALRELHDGAAAPGSLPVGTHSPGFVWDDDETAARLVTPAALATRNTIGRERGWGVSTEAQIRAEIEQGAMYVGSPETVAQKIARTVRGLGIQRFVLKYDNGLTHEQNLRSIELYATQVIPRVRELLAD
ncbi:LLM class flavin-dependent oxidoreductase [Nocardioides sp. Kera G14]|uniref:LLM class flavin-dependent oxidoreductase n=1 Tax=Nocardioides sp. Kera G14 TaxID=2884264 RepID=UPI001D126B96|nr:LLM class flavin-dependent oxidoreductase [Nocardioides sp. Kera G14]UDY22547.1 LLM class flavin-dependent oxidoreductase [Nocardioides sp. Kera G14]